MTLLVLSFAALFVGAPSFAGAFRLTPMVVQFASSGPKATQVITLENPGGEKVPVQIEIYARTSDARGEEVRTKTDEFNIYPEQVVLLPNEKRNVRITWAGEFKDANEKAFRIIASQLPVELRERNAKPKNSGVNLKFLLQYVASAYVTPEGAIAKIRVKDVKSLGAKKISLVIANEGTAHKVLRAKSLKIYSGDKFLLEILSPKEFDSLNLLPGKEQNVEVNLPKEAVGSNLRAELNLWESGD
ncbi:molecular chaperone [Bdellovibrio sp.]|uniref:fimbrial biogenesis chaperone n=1 Tax=Bdellovibrio sp. TaxID=28201 RepID=UPI0039E4ED9C